MLQISFKKFYTLPILILLQQSFTLAQSLTHPHIWIEDGEKTVILDKIASEQWAENLFNQYKNRVDYTKNSHKTDPSAVVNNIPGFPGDRTTHRNTLTLGFDAALLYWLTDDEDYAQLAADILFHYTENISGISGDIDFSSGGSDSYLIDSRFAYTKPPIIYDFIHSFLVDTSNRVYDKGSGTMVHFNMTNAQTAFKNLADNVFDRGGMYSNHPILEGPGALFNVLCIEDDAVRATYFNKFLNGASRQNGFYWMLDRCNDAGGLWPEATGYSIGPQRIILEMLNIVDDYDPSLNIVENNKELLETSFFYENYRFPNGSNVMRFGDAHRNSLNTKALMERVLTISKNKAYASIENNAYQMLQGLYEGSGYAPEVETQTLEWNNPYYLLWGSNIETNNVIPIDYSRAITIDYAGIAMQRNLNTTNPNESGLMGYTGGAHYVHSHLTGIDMEIYGLGAVLGTGGGDVGASDRGDETFRNYHRIYAGHNTVIVNGKSKGRGSGSWKADNQLYQDKTVTVGAEPASQQTAISDDFSFSSQELNDNVNNAKQQRVFSIIRTGNSTGYYFDLFRSKSLSTNNYHDYVYHNVGDGVVLKDIKSNTPLEVSSRTDRYPSYRSDYSDTYIMFPGWHYFNTVKTSDKTDKGIRATIPMTKIGTRYMHILMPGGEEREYTSCFGSATIEGQVGYSSEKTPVVSIRHYGEAWTKPFISVFEPSRDADGSVVEVSNLYNDGTIVGAKVISNINGTIITDYIISNISDDQTVNNTYPKFSFTGRFGIIRTIEYNDTIDLSLYIGEGDSISIADIRLDAGTDRKAMLNKTNVDIGLSELITELVNPVEGSSYVYDDTVHFEANAYSEEGNIEKVDFYINGEYYKTDSSAPYNATWVPDTLGTFTISAKAFDSFGQSELTRNVTVNVTHGMTIAYVSAQIEPNIAENIFDGIKGNESRWAAKEFPQYIIIGLNKRKIVTGTKMWTFRDWPYQYTVEVSDSLDSGYLMVSDQTENTSTTQPLVTSFNQAGRYVKLTITGADSYTYDWVSINELEILTSPDTTENNDDNGNVSIIAKSKEDADFDIYPNPASGEFYINLGNIAAKEVSIFSISGVLVYKKTSSERLINIQQTSKFSDGIYLVAVIDENYHKHIRKLIIQ